MNFDEAYNRICENTIKNDIDFFVEENKKFWDFIPCKAGDSGKFLVEPCGKSMFTNHQLGIGSIILNRAKNYAPLWISIEGTPDIRYYKSYVDCAEKINLPELKKFKRSFIKRYASFWYKFLIKNRKDILKFNYDGINYGDLLYDEYIRMYSLATIHEKDEKLKSLMFQIAKLHELCKQLIKENDIKAVLFSQQVGLYPCIMNRVAIKMKKQSYILIDKNLYRFDKYKEYQLTPTKKEMDDILSLPETEFNEIFKKVNQIHVSGSNMDAKAAFSSKNKYYKSRKEFCEDYKLDSNKKNIFIMLHAYNDYPHSHFDKMLFDDYYDWFIQTLEYAKRDTSVNWIVKQHPSAKRYKCTDVDYAKIFKDIPSHITYIDFDAPIDTRSLEYIADAVVTCVGSCGYDIPAMYGIPSVIAGDNHYMGYDFTKYPKNKKEYFKILSELKSVGKISEEAQKQARAMYIFVLYCGNIDNKTAPQVECSVQGDYSTLHWSLREVVEKYNKDGNEIKAMMNDIINQVSKEEFKAYRNDYKKLLEKKD